MSISLIQMQLIEDLNQLAKTLPNGLKGDQQLQQKVHSVRDQLLALPGSVFDERTTPLQRRVLKALAGLPSALDFSQIAQPAADSAQRLSQYAPPALVILQREPTPPPPYSPTPSEDAPS